MSRQVAYYYKDDTSIRTIPRQMGRGARLPTSWKPPGQARGILGTVLPIEALPAQRRFHL